jgi:hypothetical protein
LKRAYSSLAEISFTNSDNSSAEDSKTLHNNNKDELVGQVEELKLLNTELEDENFNMRIKVIHIFICIYKSKNHKHEKKNLI